MRLQGSIGAKVICYQGVRHNDQHEDTIGDDEEEETGWKQIQERDRASPMFSGPAPRNVFVTALGQALRSTHREMSILHQ